MTTLPEHGWYARYEDDAAMFGEDEAERRWFPHEGRDSFGAVPECSATQDAATIAGCSAKGAAEPGQSGAGVSITPRSTNRQAFSWSALKAQRASREVRDVAAVIDSIIAGTYEAKPIPVPQSLNAAFDSAVRQVRGNARRVA